MLQDFKLTNKTMHTISSFWESLPFSQPILSTLQIMLASCFIGICAQIKIPLYFTPVPLAITTAAIMLVGALLGSRKGALAALCYLFQGFIGLPVWAGGAIGGITYFMGATGGYLFGYVIQAYLVGWFMEKQHGYLSYSKIAAILLISTCIQLGIGSLWLAQFVGLKESFLLGFIPFIIGDIGKVIFVASCIKTYKKYVSTV